MKHIFNPDLEIIKPDWKGNPISSKGRFRNIEYPFVPSMKDVFTWQTSPKPLKQEKKIPYTNEIVKSTEFLESKKDGLCWIGHNTFLIRLGGKLLMTDPVFGSPSAMMKRFSALPFAPSQIKELDYLLITHDHRDHLDNFSLKQLHKNELSPTVLTGLNLGSLIQTSLPRARIQEAAWYQQYQTCEHVKVTYLPSRHWGRRWLNDTNKRLWGAFVLQSNEKTIYFGGDSGYGSHFAEARALFGSIDYAFIGIGAYMPEWFMGASHTSPKDALQAADDLNCNQFIPMHYGTFDLADEPMHRPIAETIRLYEEGAFNFNFNLVTPQIGAPFYF